MARLIFVLLLLIGLAYAAAALMKQATRLMQQSQAQTNEETGMPKMIPKMAYVALLVLMFGAATGSLGGM